MGMSGNVCPEVGELLIAYQRLRLEKETVRACRDLVAASDGMDLGGPGETRSAAVLRERLAEVEAELAATASRLRTEHGINDPDGAFDSSRLSVRRLLDVAGARGDVRSAEQMVASAARTWADAVFAIETELLGAVAEHGWGERELSWLHMELRALRRRVLDTVGPAFG